MLGVIQTQDLFLFLACDNCSSFAWQMIVWAFDESTQLLSARRMCEAPPAPAHSRDETPLRKCYDD